MKKPELVYKIWMLAIRISFILNFVLLSVLSFSQTGPGGVGTTDGSSNLKMWLRADKNVIYDNLKNIQSWTDFSGNNLTFTGSTSVPLFVSNAINGLPSIYFNSDQAGLVRTGITGSSLFSPSNNTIIFVKQSLSGAYWFTWQSTTPTNQVSFLLSSKKAVFNFPNNTTGLLAGSTDINGNYHILSSRTDGTNQAIILDGTQDATRSNSLTLSTAPTADLYLGTYDGTASNGWTGFIAEGLIYNTSLNSAQRTLVENYLSSKYNLSISNDRYAGDNSGNGNYDWDVSGIGAESDGKNSVANSAGLYVTENSNSLAAGEYLMAGHAGQVLNLTSSDISGSVTLRWNRNWYFGKTGSVDAKLSFDLSEGIDGGTPGNASNYVLLYRSGTSGNFSAVAGVSSFIDNSDQICFNVSNTSLLSGYYTLGTTNATDSPLDGIKTWYNYSVDNNDNWDSWDRWTLDPDGTLLLNPNHLTPGASDNVVILSGGAMNITGTAPKAATSIEIRNGAVLRIAASSPIPVFSSIKGDGSIKLSADNYPGNGTNDTDFKTKGTVEYNGAGYLLSTALSYYNLIINLTSPASIVTLKSNLAIGNDFTIRQGVFQINNGADNFKYIINVARNVTVENTNGQITTGDGDPTNGSYSYGGTMPSSGHFHDIYHEFNIGGDFTNYGTVKFTNLASPLYNNFTVDGAVTLKFNGPSNNNVFLYGPATFYNLLIDKGSSQSYITTIYSSDVANFNIYGGNAAGRNESSPYSAANPEVRKALFIKNGTLKLTGNIYLHTLSEGNMASGNGDYAIGANACLWIAGPGVTVYSTANNSTQAPSGSVGVNTASGNQALSVYGKFRISDGIFSTHNSGGIIFWSDNTGVVQLDGGSVDVSQFRSNSGSSGKAIYIQTGGVLTVRGDRTETGEIGDTYPLFGLVNTSDNFVMSGGTINILDIANGSSYGNNALYLNSSEGNYSVTGGTVNIRVDGNTTFQMYSVPNLWNLNLQRYNSSNIVTLRLNSDLTLSGNLLIDENTTINMTASGSARNLNIAGNLTLGSTGTSTSFFTTGTGSPATTIGFTGSGNSVITIINTATSGLFDPYNLIINKDNTSNTVSVLSAGRSAGTPPINIKGDFTIASGRFDYSTFTIDVKGNLSNNGIMGVWNRSGRLRLNSTTATQNITSGSGSGIHYGYIEIDKNTTYDAVLLGNNASFDRLGLTNGSIYINNFRLRVDTSLVEGSGFSATKMVKTSGENEVRGLQFKMTGSYTAASNITFPIGEENGATDLYSPLVVDFNGNSTISAGTLNVAGIKYRHPAADPSPPQDTYDFYWKTELSADFSVTNNNVNYKFYNDRTHSSDKEAYKQNGTWTITNDNANVNATTPLDFQYNFISADFTAGKNGKFNGVKVYRSNKASGNWNTANDWTPTGTPTVYDIVIISTGHAYTVTGTANAAELSIFNGGALNIGSTTGHTLRIVRGGGKFSTATTTLPTGDFDNFLLNDTAIFEYTGGSYVLPSITEYPNLKIGGNASSVKTLPTANVTVRKDLLIYDDSNTGIVLAMNNSATSGYDLTVKGNMKLNRASVFRFPATGALRNVTVEKSIELNTNGNTAANRIEIDNTDGSYSSFHRLTVKEDIKMNPNALISLFINPTNRRAVDLYFTGSVNSEITSTSPVALLALNTLTINKDLANNQSTVSSDISLTTAVVKPVIITRGHLILNNSAIDISLSAGAGNFSIPSGGKLSLRNGSVARITGTATGLVLDGGLAVENNSQMDVNDGTNDNFIEYGASGFSSITVSGTATLTVGSQIRRKTTAETGTLQYSQSGGTVTIGNSSAPVTSRAVFEVLKPGGTFTFTGGNLIIARSQSSTSPALYLDPESSTISGGATITFGNSQTPATSNIGIYSSIYLPDLVVSSSGGAKTVKLYTLGVTIDSLNINTGQTFDANGVDLTLKGNFRHQGSYTANNNTTFFTGSKQKIFGNPTFYNLSIASSDSVVLRNNININGNLGITTGKFSDCSYTIDLKGNYSNSGTHFSASNSSGGVLFAGTSRQKISGSGIFGRFSINNINGVELLNNFRLVDRNINLINGSLFIRQYRLQLGQRASVVTSSGNFSKDRMIVTNGSVSDLGVERAVASGTHSEILIPIGVFDKYTPVRISQITATSDGFIHVRPVNQYHTTALDPANVLQYYWNLQTSNFNAFRGRIDFSYSQADVAVTSPSVESDYIPAYLNGGSWAKFDSKDVDANSNIVTFNFNTGENLDGDFTAAISSALPNTVPVYYTTTNGNWETISIWAREDGLPVTSFPNGHIVKVRHNVTITQDLKYAYRTIIEAAGILNIGTTIGHYLGEVSGTGKLTIATARLPAGNYENFFTCSGGTMEYTGTASNYEIPDKASSYRSLIISGTGTRTLSLKDLTICESLTIDGPTVDNTLYNNKIIINGSFYMPNGAFKSGTGTNATLVFTGSSAQTLSGNFTGTSKLNNITLNNSSGLTLGGNVTISGILTLTSGRLITSTNALTLEIASSISPAGGSVSSYIDGPLSKALSNGSNFIFPVGKGTRYGRFIATSTSTTGASTWKVEYFSTGTPNQSNLGPGVNAVSNEYWTVTPPTGTSPVTLRWDASGSINGVTAGGINNIRLVQYAGGLWTIQPATNGTGSTNTDGTITTNSAIAFTSGTPSYFSLASIVPLIPSASFLSANMSICQGQSANLLVNLTNGSTWTLDYNDGTPHTITNINSSPYTLVVSPASTTTYTLTSVTNQVPTTGTASGSVTVTVTPLPVATFSYAGSPYCPTTANPLPTFSGGGIPGTFSSTPGLIFVSTATGQINLPLSTPGTYTVTNTISAAVGCAVVFATNQIIITAGLIWTGNNSTDWNNAANWSCGYVPTSGTLVQIPVVTNRPVIGTGTIATVNNLTIEAGSSLEISGTLRISGTVVNDGILTATAGSIEFNGTSPQVIGTSLFSGNTIKDLTINNNSGITLQGPLNISGIVTLTNGNLVSGGNLTLLSTATSTAMISGSGTGNATGNVTMQRYLPSAFGYKYFSSPFQTATVGEFSPEINLALTSTAVYRYDENRYFSGTPLSGWTNYKSPLTNVLNPVTGYAVNLGSPLSAPSPNTIVMSGAVNNGTISVTLYNHNQPYTLGLNLVGNPYPSPIDWNIVRNNNTNIANAIYLFQATDQYGGNYISYVNGVSTGGSGLNIIPSMQGFFVYVSDGTFPWTSMVTGTLTMTNSARVTDLTHPFTKSKGGDPVPVLLKLTTAFSDDPNSIDPMVIYFDEKGTPLFDNQLDALKLFNTDTRITNLYSLGSDGSKISINALSPVTEEFRQIPLGLNLSRNLSGTVKFRITEIDESLKYMNISLTDVVSGIQMDLLPDKEYSVYLDKGEYKNRFYLNLSNVATATYDISPEGSFYVYSIQGNIAANIDAVFGGSGIFSVYNLSGQILFTKRIYDKGYCEFNTALKDGIYIVGYTSGKYMISKKIVIINK